MTETEKKALALVNEVRVAKGFEPHLRLNRERYEDEALCRAIEQHEAFRQEVSDAVTGFDEYGTEAAWEKLSRFIIPKPDPLVEVLLGAWPQYADRMDACNSVANALRSALEARGLEIREKQ